MSAVLVMPDLCADEVVSRANHLGRRMRRLALRRCGSPDLRFGDTDFTLARRRSTPCPADRLSVPCATLEW